MNEDSFGQQCSRWVKIKETTDRERHHVFSKNTILKGAFLVVQLIKNSHAMQETPVQFLGSDNPLEKGMATSSILAWKFHGQRSLAGYSPWGHKESGPTE